MLKPFVENMQQLREFPIFNRPKLLSTFSMNELCLFLRSKLDGAVSHKPTLNVVHCFEETRTLIGKLLG